MRAVICNALGNPGGLHLGEFPEPEFGASQVLIDVAVAGVNFPDQLIVKGQYQASPPLPFVPGFEVAGTVLHAGSAVDDLAAGDRVIALTSGNHGGYAQRAVADADRTIALPAGIDFETAAAFYSSYGTACHALVQRGQLKTGETLVVLGAGGGLGLAAVAIGKILGATVIAVASSDAKLLAAQRHGADHCVNYKTEDLKRRIDELTGQRGADVCLDPVGGDLFDIMSRKMNWNGRLLVLGFTSGTIPSLRVNLPMLKCYQLVGVFWDSFCRRFSEENRENFRRLFGWLGQGLIRPEIHQAYRLDQFQEALAALATGQCTGRLLLKIS
jgi:NADPH2:quinone reductase